MIIHASMRTDVPAFYSEWFANRIREGYLRVRNPYNPLQVTEYSLDPEVVDLIVFCTKNPEPMLKYMDLLKSYRTYWYITITPYGADIEPGLFKKIVSKRKIIETFQQISEIVGAEHIGWRYDPIFVDEKYTVKYHLEQFEGISAALEGYTKNCVISFLDLYQKVKKNFPEAKMVSREQRMYLGEYMTRIATEHEMILRPCGEGTELAAFGADCNGCMTQQIYENAIHMSLDMPKKQPLRKECACYLGYDIGAYNSCPHMCKYCYANYDEKSVRLNRINHNPKSAFLIGDDMPNDKVHKAVQKSWINGQISLNGFFI